MKKIIKYLFLALFAGFTMVSCDFLDVVPAEKASDKDAFSSPKAAERFLYRSLLSYVELQLDIYRRLIWYRPVWTSVEMK